jgi:hypothetical protein
MIRFTSILLAFLFSAAAVRADLVLEQQISDTNSTHVVTTKIRGNNMRMDEPDQNLSVIVDLDTRDAFTLRTKDKKYLKRFGSDIRWEMSEEKKHTGGTNDLDFPPARAVDTGKTEVVNGADTEVYTWSGAHGLTETLWVDRKFPNYDGIRAELFKLDRFNDSGPHRNAQPILSMLPGMVIKSESAILGHKVTTTLVSVKVEPVDAAQFQLPVDYSPWKPPNKQP